MKGPYLRILTHFMPFDIPEWMLLEQVDECEQLSIFLKNEKWKILSTGTEFLEFIVKYPMMRRFVFHKD